MGTNVYPDQVSNGDVLWSEDIMAKDGANYVVAGRIRAVVDGTPSLGKVPCKIEHYTMNSSGTLTLAFAIDSSQSLSTFKRTSRQLVVPVCGNAKVGATAGWVVTAGTDKMHATLPAAQTSSTLVIPIDGLYVGDIITAVAVGGQVESAGNNVTLVMSVRKQTNAAADNADAEIGTDNVGTLTADTILSAANLGVTLGTPETVAADEAMYVLLTGTTAAATDIDVTHLLVTVTQN